MARESKLDIYGLGCLHDQFMEKVKAFEALVRADEQEKYKWDIHSCGPTCKRYACVAMREAVEAEREACAKLCDGWDFVPGGHEFTPQQLTKNLTGTIAAHIRARGNT
jgi:hypothetical protein